MSQESSQTAVSGSSEIQPERQPPPPTGQQTFGNDGDLIVALCQGNEVAFGQLLDTYHASLIRLAQLYVSNRSIAEELVQETWLAVLKGINRFERRSSLKTWVFRILINQAKKRAQREGRQIPFSALWYAENEPDEPAVEPERFRPDDAPQWPGHWASAPKSWEDIPETRLLSQETHACLLQAIEALPPSQREVITLRDIEGWTSDEACQVLSISEANQRVLLHRARSKVRRVLEQYLAE